MVVAAFDPQQFLYLAPEMFLAACALVVLMVGVLWKSFGDRELAIVAAAVPLLTAAIVVRVHSQVPVRQVILGGMFVLDGFSFFWKLLVLLATTITILLSVRFVEEGRYRAAEYYSLILLATTGMLFMASGYTLLTIWISLETMALASYVLAGYFKREVRSNEAAMKYFILGAMSSGVLLYGISLLYGATGTLQLDELSRALAAASADGNRLVPLGWILLGAGLFFKVSAVPFHIWTPDVYVGAPTPVTGYLAVASKAASFAILVRIFFEGLGSLRPHWQLLMAAVAVATMVWGNLAALTQDNVKRMLAYSSIAHAGYILIGVLAVNQMGLWAVLFYLLAYTFITLGAFGTVILLERKEYAGETCADYAGLARRSPFLAAMMLIFMVALTGIPPTGGFVGKVYLFAAAVQAGWTWVAVVGVVTSAISLYYYFRIVVYMYQSDSTAVTPLPLRAPALVGAIAFCALATLVLGIYPAPFIAFAKQSLLPLP
ncbi:MAG TPA: NADH-quinone oxidoreductase subunit N [Thermoanaerobaculia bacterium]|nr:NADH-quinone oxidoreductase subunit N [Thermoanaerobaculia bacterium]